jgi:dTDP-4-amino-4,6-dideoxygalactose transaminase
MYKTLEEEFAKFTGKHYAVAVNSGTAALHLSLVALGIGQGDEVIVPDFCMAAAAFAVSYTGATPVFVDCGLDLNIDPLRIEAKITKKTKAIMPVHIYGRLCDMEKINEIANKYALAVVEDACEVHGAPVGNADLTCFSFYRNKIVHAEEGGIIVTDDERLYNDMQDLKSMAFGKDHNYFHERIGFNYRMPDSQAKLALESLRKIGKNLAKRKQVEEWYNKYLPQEVQLPNREVVWVYDMMTTRADELVPKIPGARYVFKPMSTMPMYKNEPLNVMAKFFSENMMYLPVNPEMSESDVKKIVKYVII